MSVATTTTVRLVCAVLLLCLLLFALPSGARAAGERLAPGFVDTTVFSGLQEPTAVRFAPAGDPRVFVAQKDGRIWAYSSLAATTPTLVADLRTEVDNYWDRGLLGLAVDPHFPAQPYLYALYAYDAPIGGTAPKWNDTCPSPPGPLTDGCVVSGRLSRLRIDPASNTLVSETPLINDWCQQYPTHSVGDLAFGANGELLVSAGTGASWTFTDYGQGGGTSGDPSMRNFTPRNPCGDPPVGVGGVQSPPTAEGGSLRAQSFQQTDGPASLDGTVIRIDPSTGAALPANAAIANSDPNRRRIVAFGLRQPFRFTSRPGTDELWIGDVGEATWEEIDRLTTPNGPIPNFGWPCYEGPAAMPSYQAAGLNLCNSLYASGAAVPPYYTYNHSAAVVPGDGCLTSGSSITGLAFSDRGPYPASYQGALFFADHTRECIWAMLAGADGLPDPSHIVTIASPAGNPVDLQRGPDGAIYYVDHDDGQIHRLGYMTPQASATAAPTAGGAPLPVSFTGHGSSDPDPKAVLSYLWRFGDGTQASTADATHTYQRPGTYTATLTVSDQQGVSDSTSIRVTAGATPPTARIDSPTPDLHWAVGDKIDFSGSGTDAVDGQLPASDFSWSLIMHHCVLTATNCHTHHIQDFSAVKSGSFAAPDHGYPSYLQLQLTVTNSSGLTDTTSVRLDPRAVNVTVASEPAGAVIGFDDEAPSAPFTRAVIVGSTNSLTAPATIATPAGTYDFQSWSDGGARNHNVVAPSGDETLTARYAPPPQPPPAPAPNAALSGSLPTADRLLNPTTPATVQVKHVSVRTPCSLAPVRLVLPVGRSTGRAVSSRGPTLRCTLSRPARVWVTVVRSEAMRAGIRVARTRSSLLRTALDARRGSSTFALGSWLGAHLGPGRYRVTLRVTEGSHDQVNAVDLSVLDASSPTRR